MMDSETWQEHNSAYLTAALAWLQVKLARLVPPAARELRPVSSPASPVEAEEKPRWTLFRRTPAAGTPVEPRLQLPPPAEESLEQSRLEELAGKMGEAAASDPPPALFMVSEQLGLSRFEQDILLLSVAMELDTRIAPLCAAAQNDRTRPHPTFALAFALFDDPAWEALSPERPLRYYRLLEVTQPGAEPLTTSALRVDERILNYVKGLNYLDDRLAHLVVPVPPGPEGPLPASQQQTVSAIVDAALHSRSGFLNALIRVVGQDGPSKRQVVATASAALGRRLYRLSADLLPAHGGELESLARLWQREACLLPVALYVDIPGSSPGAAIEGTAQLARRFATRAGGLVFLDAGEAAAVDGAVVVDVRKPTPAEQRAVWEAALAGADQEAPALLAGQFDLGLGQIWEIGGAVRELGATGRDLREALWQQCLAKTRPGLDGLAETLTPKATWDDIVLPPAETALLRQIAGQVATRARVYDDWGFRDKMNRGLGISALFAGESGTGKTMAAEVLANELRLDLYRVDLSAVVSKYIGETEKNLRQVFDAAETGGAILFFDEADALFGKRSEVKDSHDRYANIEINYLLQRMEAYRGLAILATNVKSALDPAFVRRLRFIVNFQYPGPAERRQIWERVFPAGVPREGLDYTRLAKLNLTGGNIHSIALNAAFLAARAGRAVDMPVVLEAARTELRKMDRPVNEAELRAISPAGAAA